MSEYMSVWRISREHGFTPPTVYRWINTGLRGIKLKATKIGDNTMVLRSDLEAFLEMRNSGIVKVEEPK